ncbi:MAG: polyphosphate kinase 2 family protein [Candidatus Limnocylindrales bacterium]
MHRTTGSHADLGRSVEISKRTDLRDELRVKPGRAVRLERLDPGATDGHDRASAELETQRHVVRLRDLQDRFWAEATRAVLVVLQGIDAAGKDGTIDKVMEAFNPQGCPVTSFKVPSTEELAHDYLWRVHQHVPRKGEIGIFNRSHYESVLVERVHAIVPKRVWSTRYDQINDFERMLTENGTTVVKFFLQIDRDEQRRRFQARIDDPTKRWKFSMGDLDDRKLWADYQRAFDAALTKTSTSRAPWYVIPSNHKWFRDLAVSSILADILAGLKPAYPAEPNVPSDLVIE